MPLFGFRFVKKYIVYFLPPFNVTSFLYRIQSSYIMNNTPCHGKSIFYNSTLCITIFINLQLLETFSVCCLFVIVEGIYTTIAKPRKKKGIYHLFLSGEFNARKIRIDVRWLKYHMLGYGLEIISVK